MERPTPIVAPDVTTPPVETKTPGLLPDKTKRPPRRLPYNRPNQHQGPRNRFNQYKQPDTASINAYLKPSGYLTQISPHYEIQIDFMYFEELCTIVYETLRVREQRAVQFITQDQFVHTMKLCLFYKYYNYGYKVGTFTDRRLIDDLLLPSVQQISGTLIPNSVADYIDAIGTIKLREDDIEVQPYLYSLEEFFDEHNIFYVLREGRKTDEPCTFDNFAEQYTVGQYATSFVRVRTILHCLRCLDMEDTKGKPEMLIETSVVNQTLYRPISHFSLAEAVGHRGVVYRFWNAEADRDSGDIHQFPHRFQGTNIQRVEYMRQVVANAIIVRHD